ncbi:MAG: hypothetical protein HRF43_06890 [Phycisphaerae bacterium]|jgi:hypothetical protein
MIAIGILGIGMLMVAATFPVGLDQSRIVSEQTRAPIVANEAFTTLQRLMEEPFKRFPLGATPPTSSPTMTFADVIRTLPRGGPVQELYLPVATPPTPPALPPTLNEWLADRYLTPAGAPIAPLGLSRLYAGQQTRYYPSLPNRVLQDDSPFSWSVLVQRSPTSMTSLPVVPDYVQFIVFVNRQSAATPILIQGQPGGNALRFFTTGGSLPHFVYRMKPDPSVAGGWVPDSEEGPAIFTPGGFVVAVNSGWIYRIKSIELDLPLAPQYRNPRVELVLPTLPLTNPPAPALPDSFWLIPADPATGKSPCIGVFSRTAPL